MKELENVQGIGVGENNVAIVRLFYTDGSSEYRTYNPGDKIIINGISVGEVVSATVNNTTDVASITFKSYADNNTFTSVVGEGYDDQTPSDILPDARSSTPVTSETIPSSSDVSARRDTTETLDFSSVVVPKRKGGSDLKQVDFLDLEKVEPLREESQEETEEEEVFNPANYRVSEINKTESGIATATIYKYSNNITVGNYRVGQAVPEFENKIVEEIDTDPESATYRNVTLDDGSVIVYEAKKSEKREPGDKTLSSNQQEKIDDLNISDEEKAVLTEKIEELNSQNIEAYPIVDPNTGEIIIATNVLSDEQGLPISYTPVQAQSVLSDSGLRLPTVSEYELMRSNWDYQQDFKGFGTQPAADGSNKGSARVSGQGSELKSNAAYEKEKNNANSYYTEQGYNESGSFTGGATKVFVSSSADVSSFAGIYGGYNPNGSRVQPLYSGHGDSSTDYSEATVGVLRTGIFVGN